MKNVNGFAKNGAHNEDNLLQALKEHNLEIVSQSKAVKGISEVTDGREKINVH